MVIQGDEDYRHPVTEKIPVLPDTVFSTCRFLFRQYFPDLRNIFLRKGHDAARRNKQDYLNCSRTDALNSDTGLTKSQ